MIGADAVGRGNALFEGDGVATGARGEALEGLLAGLEGLAGGAEGEREERVGVGVEQEGEEEKEKEETRAQKHFSCGLLLSQLVCVCVWR